MNHGFKMSFKKHIAPFFNLANTINLALLNYLFNRAFVHRLVLQKPALGFFFARIIGSVAYFFTYCFLRSHHLKELFKNCSKTDLNKIALQITVNEYFLKVIQIIGEHSGLDYFADRIKIHNSDYLFHLHKSKHPVIIIVGHIGPDLASLSCLYKLGIPVLALKHIADFNCPPEIELAETHSNPSKKAFALKRAIDHLKTGGIVFVAFDIGSQKNEFHKVKFLERQYSFPSGIALMSRLTGAPIIPMHATWPSIKVRMDVYIHSPIKPLTKPSDKTNFDKELITKSARWYEKEIIKNPCLLRPYFLDILLSLPKADTYKTQRNHMTNSPKYLKINRNG